MSLISRRLITMAKQILTKKFRPEYMPQDATHYDASSGRFYKYGSPPHHNKVFTWKNGEWENVQTMKRLHPSLLIDRTMNKVEFVQFHLPDIELALKNKPLKTVAQAYGINPNTFKKILEGLGAIQPEGNRIKTIFG